MAVKSGVPEGQRWGLRTSSRLLPLLSSNNDYPFLSASHVSGALRSLTLGSPEPSEEDTVSVTPVSPQRN